MAHSIELRNRALSYYERCKNISQVAQAYQISRNTLYRWIHLKEQTGSLAHQVKGQNAIKLDSQKLAEHIQQHPDAYLHEIAEHFNCSKSAIFYALRRMGITRKKRVPHTKNKTKIK